jgi:hypothetical protein
MQPTPGLPMRRRACYHRSAALAALCVCASLALMNDGYSQVQPPRPTDPVPGTEPAPPGNARPGETLSEQLDRSHGVIPPPAGIDPKIEAPAPEPNPGTTRVIPPPGSPGGDPNVQPK